MYGRRVRLVHGFKPGGSTTVENIGVRLEWEGHNDAEIFATAEELGIPRDKIQIYRSVAYYDVPFEEIPYWSQKVYPYVSCKVGDCDSRVCPLSTPQLDELYRISVEKYLRPWREAFQKWGIEAPEISEIQIPPKAFRFSSMDDAAQVAVQEQAARKAEEYWRSHPEISFEEMENIWGAILRACCGYTNGGMVAEVHAFFFQTDQGEFVAQAMDRHFAKYLPGRAVWDKFGAWFIIKPPHYPRFVRVYSPPCWQYTLVDWCLSEARKEFEAEVRAKGLMETHCISGPQGPSTLEAVYNRNIILRGWISNNFSHLGAIPLNEAVHSL